jgi:putative endonuclease
MDRDHALVSDKRRSSEKLGRLAEFIAAAFLMLKGYRILGRRVRSSFGEIDLIAVRGRRLAFVEVKYRDSLEAAENSITHAQADRIATAAEQWAWAHPAYRSHSFGLDAIYIAPWRLPRHLIDGLQV